jgi:hypothetical protein
MTHHDDVDGHPDWDVFPEDVQETYLGLLEKLLKRMYWQAQSSADDRHREVLAAIINLKEAITSSIADPAKLEAINRGLVKVTDQLDAINAAGQKQMKS